MIFSAVQDRADMAEDHNIDLWRLGLPRMVIEAARRAEIEMRLERIIEEVWPWEARVACKGRSA